MRFAFGNLVTLMLLGCSGADDSPPGDGGTASGGSGGSGSASGGGGGSGACAGLESARAAALEAARQCVPNGDSAECGDDASVSNECGCPVAVNSSGPDRVTAAQDAYDAWSQSCDPPSRCQAIDCAQVGGTSTCVGAPGEAVCRW